MEPEFGDFEPDDAFTVGDEEVDWSEVDRLSSQVESIQGIDDSEERLDAAKTWAGELEGVA